MKRLLLLVLAVVAALPAADLGPGPTPTNTTLLAPGPIGSTTPSSGAFTTLTTTGTATLGADASAGESVNINAAAASERSLWFRTASLGRWKAFADSIAEAGSDAGSDFHLAARNDAGSNLGDVLVITRAAGGSFTVNRPLVAASDDVIVSTAGKGLKVKEGTNARMGTATLVAGASTVSNTSVTANTRIFLTSNADGGTPGFLRVSARVASTSFTITSSSGTDTSTVAWVLVEPAP